jgi:hypothetical protein
VEDVKMEEDKPKEDTFEDIPEGVLNVGLAAYLHWAKCRVPC